MKNPRFLYDKLVRVKAGFYKGHQGRVRQIQQGWMAEDRYWVIFLGSEGAEWFNSSDLEGLS